MSLSTCYNALGFGCWEELCHEYMSSVLPTDDPRMPVDDLSSPMWRIIFLKDDCFLQPPSCEVTSPSSSDPDSLTICASNNNNNKINTSISTNTTITTTTATTITATTITAATTTAATAAMMDSYDHHDPTTCPSNPIEPLFEGIDLTHHHQYKDTITNTATTQQKQQESCNDSDVDTQHHDVLPPSPSLSRSSSSLTLSDIEHDTYQQQQGTTITLAKPLKRKRKTATSQRRQQQQRPRHRQKKQKQVRHHTLGGSPTTITTSTTLETADSTTTTLFEQLSYAGIDWCRYCGTTEGVNWRPGPWGKRTLCK
ncbi:hypothetical protein BCR42DRAFT_213494 [Absidia repens]|uniref:GATA-type domain-containing protein n=1 Tax=Absidia repens TaxID=90262 RepID=A0A1X2IR86_9FUNG|nr:hypothetical protein BCR42DRAFT_213494 [Absidia repens]